MRNEEWRIRNGVEIRKSRMDNGEQGRENGE